jgi:hypothetical protein
MKKSVFSLMMMVAAMVAASMFAGCSTSPEVIAPDEPEGELQPIAIDGTDFQFGSKAVERHQLSVMNTTDWTVTNETDWVLTEKRPDNTLYITVQPSRSLVDRAATLTVAATNAAQGAATFVVNQRHGTPTLYIRQLNGGIAVRHVSADGRWAVGQRASTSVVIEVAKLADSTYAGALVNMPNGSKSIDNNGKPYHGGCAADGSMYCDYDSQDVSYNGDEFFPSVHTPYVVRNNRKLTLPMPATYSTSTISEDGFSVPLHQYQGCIPDKMSADGKHIFGRLVATGVMWVAAKWTRIGNTNDYEFKELGQNADGDLNKWEKVFTEFEGKRYMTTQPVSFLCPQNVSGLSPYGKYACGHYGGSMSGGGQLWRYDMEANALELLNESNSIAVFITDEGDLFTEELSNHVYRIGKPPITLRQWIAEVYGSEIAENIGFVGMGGVSADKSTTVLYGVGNTMSYIITVEP